jgi:MFS family permease
LPWFFLAARVLSSLGFMMQGVAVGWQVYALTKSPLALGLVGLTQFLPMLALTLLVGVVADRHDRRLIARLCQGLMGVVLLALAIASFANHVGVIGIFAAVFMIGAARAFEHPTLATLLPALVAPAAMPRATARSASANQVATIIGPSLGGLLYGVGPEAAYGAAGLAYLGASLSLALLASRSAPRLREKPTLASVLSGIAFIRSERAMLGAISLDLFAVLLGGATALLPVYARDILHTSPLGLGVLRSAPAVGALTASLIVARHPFRERAGAKMFAGVFVFGAATIVFGLSTSFILSLAALATLGAADVVSVVIRFTLVQLRTPDAMRGRVTAVNSLFIGTSNQLGEFESGFTAALFGTVPAVLIGGIGTLAVALLWIRLFPELWRADRLDR